MTIKQTLNEILSALRMPANDRLWDCDDIAAYFNCSRRKADDIRAEPGFPRPIRPTPNATAVYVPDEVKKFALKKRG